MKKLILLFIIGLCSCGPSREEMEKYHKPGIESEYSYDDTPRGISVVKIDSCEYVYAEVRQGVCIIHKFNCKNHGK